MNLVLEQCLCAPLQQHQLMFFDLSPALLVSTPSSLFIILQIILPSKSNHPFLPIVLISIKPNPRMYTSLLPLTRKPNPFYDLTPRPQPTGPRNNANNNTNRTNNAKGHRSADQDLDRSTHFSDSMHQSQHWVDPRFLHLLF